jgi:hypothetical protein
MTDCPMAYGHPELPLCTRCSVCKITLAFMATIGQSARVRSPHRISRFLGCFAVAVALSACGPGEIDRTGVTGMGVDGQGDLIGYIAMCSGHIDGATLYQTDGATLGEWTAPNAVTESAKWPLGQSSDWTAKRPYRAPSGSDELNLYGWSDNNSTGASHVTFHLDDLSQLRPGQVLYWSDSLKTAEEGTFRRDACADYGMPVP